MQKHELIVICIKCKKENISFFSSSNNEIKKESNNSQTLASSSINSFFEGINEFNNNQNSDNDDDNDNDDNDDDDKLPINCKYLDIDSNMEIPIKKN